MESYAHIFYTVRLPSPVHQKQTSYEIPALERSRSFSKQFQEETTGQIILKKIRSSIAIHRQKSAKFLESPSTVPFLK